MRHWTQEERQRQASLIHNWKPWKLSTGPKTSSGKARSNKNSFVHGGYNKEVKTTRKYIMNIIRQYKDSLHDLVDIVS